MWIEIGKSDKKYHLMLSQTDDESMVCFFYDGNECWHEQEDLENLFQRAKDCNKRIKYDKETVKSTLLNGTPVDGTFLKNGENTEEGSLTLKFKVQLYPFTFVWKLKKCILLECYAHIMDPFLKVMEGFDQQNIALRAALRKKDTELYRRQLVGDLSAKDSAISPRFDFNETDKKYAKLKANLEIYKDIYKHLKEMPLNPIVEVSMIDQEYEPKTELQGESNETSQAEFNKTNEKVFKTEIKIEVKSDSTTSTLEADNAENNFDEKSPTKTNQNKFKRKIEYLSSDESPDKKKEKA